MKAAAKLASDSRASDSRLTDPVACHDHIFKKNVRRAAATESQANRTRLVMKRDGSGGIGRGEEEWHNGRGSFHGCGLNDSTTDVESGGSGGAAAWHHGGQPRPLSAYG